MKMMTRFSDSLVLCEPPRTPRRTLAEQIGDGHRTLHNDKKATEPGLRAGPGKIEGPTHFSRFVPLLHHAGAHWPRVADDPVDAQAFGRI